MYYVDVRKRTFLAIFGILPRSGPHAIHTAYRRSRVYNSDHKNIKAHIKTLSLSELYQCFPNCACMMFCVCVLMSLCMMDSPEFGLQKMCTAETAVAIPLWIFMDAEKSINILIFPHDGSTKRERVVDKKINIKWNINWLVTSTRLCFTIGIIISSISGCSHCTKNKRIRKYLLRKWVVHRNHVFTAVTTGLFDTNHWLIW